jgi:hypothetical protein
LNARVLPHDSISESRERAPGVLARGDQGAVARLVAEASDAFAPAATAVFAVAFPQLSSVDDASQFASG